MWSCLSIQDNTSINSQIHLLFIHTCIFSFLYTYQYSTCISKAWLMLYIIWARYGLISKCNRNDFKIHGTLLPPSPSLPFSSSFYLIPLLLSPVLPFPFLLHVWGCTESCWVGLLSHFTSVNIFGSCIHKHYLQIWKLFT